MENFATGAETSLEEGVPEPVRQVLCSRTFERASTLRALLVYLWQHRNEPIGEYAIATEALGRSPKFDPRTDATVRVQVSRLRQRLEKYYVEEGKGRRQRVIIPLGTHKLHLEIAVGEPMQVEAMHAEVLPAAGIPTRPVPRQTSRYLAMACIGLAVLAGALGIGLYRAVHTSAMKSPDRAPRFWRTFFGPMRPTRILLPTPVFFAFGVNFPNGESTTVMLRDTTVNEFNDSQQARFSNYLHQKLGQLSLAQNYTVTSDTFASVSLVRYLDQFSLPTRVRSSADGPMEALDTENVIALGTWGTLTPLQAHLDRMSLSLGPHELWVDVRNPGPGEPSRISRKEENAERAVWPGVVAVLPGHRRPDGMTHLLVMASRHTSALVSTLASDVGLEQVERLWRAKGSPEYFEMVVNCEMNGSEMVRSWPVLMRRLPGEAPGNSK